MSYLGVNLYISLAIDEHFVKRPATWTSPFTKRSKPAAVTVIAAEFPCPLHVNVLAFLQVASGSAYD